VYVHRNHYPIF